MLYFMLRTVYLPLRLLARVAWRGLVGVAILWGVNLAGSVMAFAIPINWFTALTVGYLGVPGLLLILALRRLAA